MAMNFDSGTAYAESDADDEYEREFPDSSPIDNTDAEQSPIDSDPPSNEPTPTSYGYRTSADRLPETIISEWTADECADFIATIGLEQYSNKFIGLCPLACRQPIEPPFRLTATQRTRLSARLSLRCCMTI